MTEKSRSQLGNDLVSDRLGPENMGKQSSTHRLQCHPGPSPCIVTMGFSIVFLSVEVG